MTGDDDPTVSNAGDRWEWLSTVGALLLISSFVAYIGLAILGMATLSAISQGWFLLYFTSVFSAIVYAFGRHTMETVHQYRSGKFK